MELEFYKSAGGQVLRSKGQRSLWNRLKSPIDPFHIFHIVIFGLIICAVITIVWMLQFESFLSQQVDSQLFSIDLPLHFLIQFKYFIPGLFIAFAGLIYLLAKGVREHIKGEELALRDQVHMIRSGRYDERRHLRKKDIQTQLMNDLHDLAGYMQKLEEKLK